MAEESRRDMPVAEVQEIAEVRLRKDVATEFPLNIEWVKIGIWKEYLTRPLGDAREHLSKMLDTLHSKDDPRKKAGKFIADLPECIASLKGLSSLKDAMIEVRAGKISMGIPGFALASNIGKVSESTEKIIGFFEKIPEKLRGSDDEIKVRIDTLTEAVDHTSKGFGYVYRSYGEVSQMRDGIQRLGFATEVFGDLFK